jgi:hypothetical protein
MEEPAASAGSGTSLTLGILISAILGRRGCTINSCLNGSIKTSISSNGRAPNSGSQSPGKTMARQIVLLFLNRSSTGPTISHSFCSPFANAAIRLPRTRHCKCTCIGSLIASITAPVSTSMFSTCSDLTSSL